MGRIPVFEAVATLTRSGWLWVYKSTGWLHRVMLLYLESFLMLFERCLISGGYLSNSIENESLFWSIIMCNHLVHHISGEVEAKRKRKADLHFIHVHGVTALLLRAGAEAALRRASPGQDRSQARATPLPIGTGCICQGQRPPGLRLVWRGREGRGLKPKGGPPGEGSQFLGLPMPVSPLRWKADKKKLERASSVL